MRGQTDLFLAPLDRKANGKQNQGTNRGPDASPTRQAGYGSSGAHRSGPFPPVPRPGTTGTPYLLGAARRPQFTSGSQSDRERDRGSDGSTTPSAALPRLPEPSPGCASSGVSGVSGGTRHSPQHTRASGLSATGNPPAVGQVGRANRMGGGRVSPGDNGVSPGSFPSPPTLMIPSVPGGASTITWAQVRDAQQHAWAESGYFKSQQQYLVAAAAAAAAAQLQQQQQSTSPPQAQSSWGDLSWGGPEGPLAASASTLSLTSPGGNSGNAAAWGPLPVTAPSQLLHGAAAAGTLPRGRGGPTGGFGTDLAELERDLRDRERDLVNGLARSSWSAGGPPSPWAPERGSGSPPRSNGRGGEAAAAGLLAYEKMVGPQFGSLGLLEGLLGASGGGGGCGSSGSGGGTVNVLVMAASGMSPTQIQAAQQQQAQVHTLQRRTLMLRLPHTWNAMGLEMPAMVVQDANSGSVGSGGACLLVLPSDKPPTRSEAAAVEALLLEMLRDPETAAARAVAWRADALGSLCSEAIACLHEASKLRQAPGATVGGGGLEGGGGGGGGAASGDGAGVGAKWQLRGLDGVELSAPSILGPFTTLLQPSLQAHTAAIEAHRAGLASAHVRTPTANTTSAGAKGAALPISPCSPGGAQGGAEAGSGGGDRRGVRRLHGSPLDAATLRSGRSLMSPYSSTSLTVGVCVCLADLIRQVEVQCCERGRALASAWNAFMVAHQDSMDSLRRRAAGLQREVEQLTGQLAERHDFTREIEMLEFLKRENARYKSREADLLAKGLLTLQTAPGARDGSRLVVKAGGALGEALETELNSRISRLRWQQAAYTLGTQTKRVAFQSGLAFQKAPPPHPRLTAGGPEAEAMVIKLTVLQRLTLAVERVQRRRQAAEARRKAAEEARARGCGGAGGAGAGAGLGGASPAELAAAVAAAGPGVGLKLLEGLDPEDTARLLSALGPEAQVVLLGSLQELKRAEVLAAMADADRAQAVAVMSSGMRAHTARVLGRGMWMTTMRCIKENSQLGARLLGGMEHQEAVDELVTWTSGEQLEMFPALDLPTAARLMLALPMEMRQKLLTAMAPHLAANILSTMLPAPAAGILDELDFVRAFAILMAMDPAGAANILHEMGCARAAEMLLGMDDVDVRNAILECMMPRMAAETVLEMDTRANGAAAAAAAGNAAEVDISGVSFVVGGGGAAGPVGSGAQAAAVGNPFPGTEALVEMPSASADKILGFMTVQEKAALLARMDPERAAEQLAHLGPNESVALLACLADAAQVMVVEALKQDERDAMMKVLADASGYKFRGGRNKGKGRKNANGQGRNAANAKGASATAAAATAAATAAAATAAATTAAAPPQTPPAVLGSSATPSLPLTTSMPVASSPVMVTALSPRLSVGGSSPRGGATAGLTQQANGGGGSVSHLAVQNTGYNVEMAVSMAAAVGRRALEFIDEYSDGEGEYEERMAPCDARGRRWSHDNDIDVDGAGGETGDGATTGGTGDGAGGSRSGDGGISGGGGDGRSGDGVTANACATESELDDFTDARGSVDGPGPYNTGARRGGRMRNAVAGGTARRGVGGTFPFERDVAEDDLANGDDSAIGPGGIGGGASGSGGIGGGTAAAATALAAATATDGRVSPVVGILGAEAPFAGFNCVGGGRHSICSTAGVAGAASGSATGMRRYRASEVDMQHLSRQQQQQLQQLHAHAMARRSGRGDFSPVSPASPIRGAASGVSTPSRVTPQQTTRSSPHTMGYGYGSRGTADGGGPPGTPGSSRGGYTVSSAGVAAAGANNLSSIKAAFRMNRQQQMQGQGVPPLSGSYGLIEMLRGPMVQDGQGPSSRQSPVSQMLLKDFRDIAAVGPVQTALNPKNARLATALAQHRTARPRPKGWLMGLVESVYKDGEALQRRMGQMEALRRFSVPEIVFAHFSNKYGQRSLVDEYAACLANTLALHRAEDLRLEMFARFFTEQWDFATFFDFLSANSLALQPSKVLCIEYPREASRDEQYPWLCSHKAAAIADVVMGPRSQALRDRFNEALLAVSLPADDADLEKLKRDPRYVAAAAEAAAGGPPLPERFYRLPRPRFLALLVSEISRLNAAITRMARSRFEALDLVGNEVVPAGAVPGYLSSVVSPKSAQGSNWTPVQESAQLFVADALAYQQDPMSSPEPAAAGAGPEVKLTVDAWVAASVHCQLIRDHFKLKVLRPRRLDAEGVDDGADDGTAAGGDSLLGGFLLGLTRRHTKIMSSRFKGYLTGIGGGGGDVSDATLISELSAAVDKAVSGGDKFRAYAQMLLAIIKQQVAAAVGLLVGDKASTNEMAGSEVEDALCRLEDCALIMLKQAKYLMECSSPEVQVDLVRRLAPQARIFTVGRQLLVSRQHRITVRHMAALVVQSIWRGHRRRRKVMAAAATAAQGQGLMMSEASVASLGGVQPAAGISS